MSQALLDKNNCQQLLLCYLMMLMDDDITEWWELPPFGMHCSQ
jgi:hypothetical protein